MKAVRWGAALAFLALSATAAAAQDLPTKAIEVPQSRHWIDYPPNWGYDPLAKQLLSGLRSRACSRRRMAAKAGRASTTVPITQQRRCIPRATGWSSTRPPAICFRCRAAKASRRSSIAAVTAAEAGKDF